MKDSTELTLAQKLRHWASVRPDDVALRQKDFGIWQAFTWREYWDLARHFGLGLARLGLERGGHVAIISENRKEWVIAQLGCGCIGAVTVGVYPTSPAPEVEYLLATSEASIVVCEDQEQLDKVLEVQARLPRVKHVVVIDPRGLRHYRTGSLHRFEDVLRDGAEQERLHPGLVEERLAAQGADDTALMIFTSGSTGRPKGAMITYDNIDAQAAAVAGEFGFTERDTLVSYLPLCHVAEQIFTVFVPIAVGATVNFAESLRTIQADVREIAPSIFLGVPRIWEKLHAAILIKAGEAGGLRKWLFERAFAGVRSFAAAPRDTWTVAQRLRYGFWYVVVFRALLNFIGLRCARLAFSGTAPIAPQMLEFFRVLGVPVRELYGMTESSGVATGQRSGGSPPGTVGAPMPGLEVRLAEDGELLMRGRTIFKGYYKNAQATAQAIDAEGWLHSGDVAVWAGEELRIVDRKKDIMITSGGKNISPSEVENALKCSAYIKEAIVIGEGRHFVSALIQIDYETVGKWAEDHGIAYTTFRSLAMNPKVRELIEREIEQVNAQMPRVQHVRKFHLLTKELDHDDGEVTATMKLRRSSLSEKYADVITSLYQT